MKASNQKRCLHLILLICLVILLNVFSRPVIAQAEEISTQISHPLVANPVLPLTYQWHTFSEMVLSSIVVDNAGNIYAAGSTDHTWGSPLHAYSGGYDIGVIKFNRDGVYQWHTFFGAEQDAPPYSNDGASGVVIDGDGNLYLTGNSHANWLGSDDTAPIHDHDGTGLNMFVLKLNGSGEYQWHTFYQSGWDKAIALDSDRNIYVTGLANAEWGDPKHSIGEAGSLVVMKFTNDGNYVWHTYYGSTENYHYEIGTDIAVDSQNNVVVSGFSSNSFQGDNDAPPLNPISEFGDIFVLKLNSSGVYQWHTFFGSASSDESDGIATVGNDIYVVGDSNATWGDPIHAYNENGDITVLKLNANGQLQWNTFFGSTSSELGWSICTDLYGDLYILGESADAWLGPMAICPSILTAVKVRMVWMPPICPY